MEIKEQLKQDEELIVKVFQLERFVRKHKIKLIGVGVVLTLGVVGYSIYSAITESRIEKANQILVELGKRGSPQLLEELKEKEKSLYDLQLLKSNNPADWAKVTTPILKEVAQYKLAVQKGSIDALEKYLYNPDFHLMKDNVRFLLIKLYLQKGERKKGLELYSNIQTPEIKNYARLLLHYGIKK
jgi:predicted negative regulator of RcsB-dependent stress response